MKDDALKWICEQSAEISDHHDVFSCTWIAKGIHESVSQSRQMEADGYVRKDHEGGVDEWTNEIYYIHGYSLTEKGHNRYFIRKDVTVYGMW